MRTSANARITYVWIVLCGLTVLAWSLAKAHGDQRITASRPEALAVLAIAAVKARFIMQQFMEVRTAPRWLRRFTDAWVVGLVATVGVLYLYA